MGNSHSTKTCQCTKVSPVSKYHPDHQSLLDDFINGKSTAYMCMLIKQSFYMTEPHFETIIRNVMESSSHRQILHDCLGEMDSPTSKNRLMNTVKNINPKYQFDEETDDEQSMPPSYHES